MSQGQAVEEDQEVSILEEASKDGVLTTLQVFEDRPAVSQSGKNQKKKKVKKVKVKVPKEKRKKTPKAKSKKGVQFPKPNPNPRNKFKYNNRKGKYAVNRA